MFYEVLIASNRFHGESTLTYSSDEILKVGQVVLVSLRGHKTSGIIHSNQTKKPNIKISSIEAVTPYIIPGGQIKLINWLKNYYPAPMGSLAELLLPPGILKEYSFSEQPITDTKHNLPPLTDEQAAALNEINEYSSRNVLVHGDTGSGKTRLYIEAARQKLEAKKSVLILCPEIGLTELLREQFARAFDGHAIHVIHSNKTTKQRQIVWQAIAQSSQPVIVIGARSALFAPIHQLGLIIVDEAHDTAYKQEQQPYYQTTRLAARLAKLHGGQALFGTATPLVNDYYMFESKKLPIVRLTKPAITSVTKVEQIIVDLSDKSKFSRSSNISDPLFKLMDEALDDGEQILLFLNRRGSARLVLCDSCGWQSHCSHCDVSLVYHADKHHLLCHSCGRQSPIPNTCPVCNSSELLYSVPGTKAIEIELLKHFPQAKVARFDRDTTTDQKLEKLYSQITSGEIDILLGTQGLVKGFDLPKLSVVGVLQADSSLQIADYTASERTYQLISQVAGRLGRGHRNGKLVLQTYTPDSKLLRWAIDKNYNDFYHQELRQRESFLFPPACYILKITAKRASAASAQKALTLLQTDLAKLSGLLVHQPAPSYPEKMAGKYRWQIIIRSKNRKVLAELAAKHNKRFTCDLDPVSLL